MSSVPVPQCSRAEPPAETGEEYEPNQHNRNQWSSIEITEILCVRRPDLCRTCHGAVTPRNIVKAQLPSQEYAKVKNFCRDAQAITQQSVKYA